MLRRIAIRIVLLALCILPVAAQDAAQTIDPKKQAALDELIAVMNLQDQQKQVLDQVKGLVRKQLEDSLLKEMSKHGDPNLIKADYQVFLDKIFDRMTQRLSWDRMRPEYVALYGETFTTEEIRDMLVFYKTPSGKAMLLKMPAVVARGITIGQKMMVGFEQEMQPFVAEFVEKAKSRFKDQ